MSLFGKRGGIFGASISGGLFGSGLYDDGPNVIEKVEMLFTDVETEGKKQGYDSAAREYGKVYRDIENEFLETKKIIEQQKNSYDNKADSLISKLESLEREKGNLEKQVNDKAKEVSRRFDIPVGDVKKWKTYFFLCFIRGKETFFIVKNILKKQSFYFNKKNYNNM